MQEMDRGVLLAPAYPVAAFVDAFYHVVWSRRGALTVPSGPRFDSFRDAARATLTRVDLAPEACVDHATRAALCAACATASAWVFDGREPCSRLCDPRARVLIERLFFRDTAWTGDLPPCAARCHTIATSRDQWAVAEAIYLPLCTPSPNPRAGHAVNRITYGFDRGSAHLASRVRTENATALTCGLVLLCQVVAAPERARQLYIDVREALRSGEPGTSQVAAVHSAVLHVLLGGLGDHDVAPELAAPTERLRDFLVRHAALAVSPYDAPTLNELRPRRSSTLACELTRDHEVSEHAGQFGAYVELTWPDAAMSALECRLTVRLWTALLKFVAPMHVLIKTAPNGKHAIVLRRADYVRLLQFAPCRLHCSRVISLRMPVYKMMCQNYVEANMTRDVAGAIAFVKDLASLVSASVPDAATDTVHQNLGILHGLIGLFADTLPLHLQRPLMDGAGMRINPRETYDESRSTSFGESLVNARVGPFQNAADNATVVKGIEWTATTIYGAVVAFLCVREPHVIAGNAVRELFDLMTRRVHNQPNFRAAMAVVSELWGRFSRPALLIDGSPYVDIPLDMHTTSFDNAPPVSYIYGFLLSDYIDRRQAARVFMAIRLSPEKSTFLSSPTPLKLAETRDEGVAGLRSLAREYTPSPPTGPFARLYTRPGIAELGCLQYFLFLLEMHTYVQGEALHCDNLSQCVREYAKTGSRPHAPLQRDTFRGAVTPAHILRYARRDDTHDPGRTTMAYELEPGVFQNEVVPTVRLRERFRGEDYSRLGPDSPFVGADPFLIECAFMIPVDTVQIESTVGATKRKLDAAVANSVARDPNVFKRMRAGTPVDWDREARFVNMALSSRGDPI